MKQTELESSSAPEAAQAHAEKKAYQSPELTDYGKVTELVQTGSVPVPIDFISTFAT